MFKKEMEAGQPADRSQPASQPGSTPPAGSRRSSTGSGQVAVIGRSIHINGDVKGDEDLLIEGDVSGTVELKNNSVTIGAEGKVQADIYARVINVEGTTDGDLYASERISIRASANLRGNLVAPRIALEDGARFKGSIDMDPQAVEKAVGAAQTKTAQRTDSPASSAKSGGDIKSPAMANQASA